MMSGHDGSVPTGSTESGSNPSAEVEQQCRCSFFWTVLRRWLKMEILAKSLGGDGRINRRASMKFVLSAAMICILSGTALADAASLKSLLRVAQSNDACLASCSSQIDSCKRVCPTTFNTPCLSACDSQAQSCRQNCQTK
jgi:hypothetical protein